MLWIWLQFSLMPVLVPAALLFKPDSDLLLLRNKTTTSKKSSKLVRRNHPERKGELQTRGCILSAYNWPMAILVHERLQHSMRTSQVRATGQCAHLCEGNHPQLLSFSGPERVFYPVDWHKELKTHLSINPAHGRPGDGPPRQTR